LPKELSSLTLWSKTETTCIFRIRRIRWRT